MHSQLATAEIRSIYWPVILFSIWKTFRCFFWLRRHDWQLRRVPNDITAWQPLYPEPLVWLLVLHFLSWFIRPQTRRLFTSALSPTPQYLRCRSTWRDCGRPVGVLPAISHSSALMTLARQCILVKSNSEHLEQIYHPDPRVPLMGLGV